MAYGERSEVGDLVKLCDGTIVTIVEYTSRGSYVGQEYGNSANEVEFSHADIYQTKDVEVPVR